MISPAVLKLDELILPIPGPAPSGEPLADGVRLQLDELRKEPDDFDPSTAGRIADWPKIIRLASENLQVKSKDLLLAVRLVEAITKKNGLAGLRDGLQLLGRLSADCWEYLHPIPGPGEDAEIRVGPFNWLNDAMRGAKFPQVITALPLVKAGTKAFAYVDSIVAARKKELEESVPKIDMAALQTTYEDLQEAKRALEELSKTLDERLGSDVAPNFLSPENTASMGTALDQCIHMVWGLGKRRGVDFGAAPAVAAEAEAGDAADATGAAAAPVSVANTREELYKQLGLIATTLKRIEPHSPIPFMLDRCVRLGMLPFPVLMRAIMRETAPLDELDRIMGIEKEK